MSRTLFTIALALTSVLMSTAALAKGGHQPHAVTLWWVIFNNPQACLTSPQRIERCGSLDVFGADYLGSVAAGDPNPALIRPNVEAGLAVLYATGGTTDPKTGKIRLTASIYRTRHPLNLIGDLVIDPLGLKRGFTSANPEVHLVVRDHGRVRRHDVFGQITGFLDPYCADPLLLVEGGPNTCRDVQFAVFGAGETGRDAITRSSDGQNMPYAAARLFRQGDLLLTVIETRIRDRRRGRDRDD